MPMLRPERMSKVSVTGSRRVMEEVVETVHGLNLLHVTDYDGSWEGFERGDPVEGAEDASEKLVTVRSIESILDVDEEDAGPTRIVEDDAVEEELESVRQEVNELDDRRDDLRSELRDVEERLEAMEPFVDLGIDLDLLGGYDSLSVAVGEGDADAVERALAEGDGVDAYEVFTGDETDVLAAFARTREEAGLEDLLVGVRFSAVEVPDVGDHPSTPSEYVAELRNRKAELKSELSTVREELESVKVEAAGFLLAAEEKLSIEVQKTEAPLSFATTENAFVAEGWVPTERYTELAAALTDAVGDHVEVEELERASFDSHGREALREQVPGSPEEPEPGSSPTAADGGEGARADGDGEARADGGNVVMRNDEPPVIQNNPGVIRPFEVLVTAVGRPNYREFDPTVVLFLTFPTFFGFMIGDVGYGLLYSVIGYYLLSNYEADAFRSMGGVTLTAGLMTMLFGLLYGEIFGLHLVTTYIWEPLIGGAPMHKGLQPAEISWAQTWLIVSALAAIAHLNIGYVFDLVEQYEFHGPKDAALEVGSWILMMNGFWVFVLSRLGAEKKPDFLFTVFDGSGAAPEAGGEFAHAAFALGFNGFSPALGIAGLAAFVLGLVMIWASGEIGEAIEASLLLVFTNGVSYTRIAAVLLAKAGMAFVVNLLFFGAYRHDGEFHFMLTHGPEHYAAEYGAEAIMFGGLLHGSVAALLVGLVVLVVGHLLVLALGVTSAGLQAVRLEYYEFFSKFYDGGGREYDPLGYERRYTGEE